MNRRLIVVSPFLLAGILSGCSSEQKASNGATNTTTLSSDMELRSVQYFIENPAEAAQVRKICDDWRASQRPIGSWPSVVMQNCENEGNAHAFNLQRKSNDKFQEQMGVKNGN